MEGLPQQDGALSMHAILETYKKKIDEQNDHLKNKLNEHLNHYKSELANATDITALNAKIETIEKLIKELL